MKLIILFFNIRTYYTIMYITFNIRRSGYVGERTSLNKEDDCSKGLE